MLENSRLGKQFRNVLKVFSVAVLVYLALTIKIWLTGERDQIVQVDYLSAEQNFEINSWSSQMEIDSHWASSLFIQLCEKYFKICKKITRSWTFTDDQKSAKLAYVAYILKNLDANITRWKMPSETLLAMLINDKKWSRRGSANRDTITINIWKMEYNNEFFQVVSHEMGHIIDLWWLQWTSWRKSSNFTEFGKEVFSLDDPSLEYYKYSWSSEKVRKSWMTKENFCSGYGMSDPFEDFAECHNLYLNHHDYFRTLALANDTVKNKYNYFSNLYGWNYINDSEAKYENRESSYRVRDTTKIREW